MNTTNDALGTIAYVIIKNDSIWFENYYGGFNEDSKSNSFSMAKSYVSGLMGKAIMEGKIKSLDQPVGDYFLEFSEGLAAKMTVGDLSSMSSGTNWDEAYYSPLSITTRAYFDDNLEKNIIDSYYPELHSHNYEEVENIIDPGRDNIILVKEHKNYYPIILVTKIERIEKGKIKPSGHTVNKIFKYENNPTNIINHIYPFVKNYILRC